MEEQTHKTYHGTVDTVGRILLPAELRNQVEWPRGTKLVMEPCEGGVRLISVDHAIREAQAFFRQFAKSGKSAVDELIAERRDEAARE